MFRKKRYFLIIPFLSLLLVCNSIMLYAQEVMTDLENGFLKSKPELIVKHFDDEIKVIILKESYNPNREEAISILSSFFSKNSVESFENKFKSGKTQSNFIIKILKTKGQTYRVTVFFKKNGGSTLINLLRIELEDESTNE